MENRENFMLAMIRRFNSAVIKFIMTAKLKTIGAMIICSFAGLSLTTTVIPSAFEMSGIMDSFSARWDLGGFASYSMVIWAVGGWKLQKRGSKLLGAIILGSVGLCSGLIFTGAGIGMNLTFLAVGGGIALVYGAVGGMIVADAFRSPPPAEDDPEDRRGTVGELGMFKYFKQ